MRSKEEIEKQIEELRAEICCWKRMHDDGKVTGEQFAGAVVDKEYYIRVLKYALGEFEWFDVVVGKEV